ncbi:MAG TPA: 4-(cytidine 5'-diphospho)-2-C-methyl-D-erythritol kinase [Terriglobia bacterium]|nr:4-(cytidine 5'-diphospho)-2-C-methyl-D-erythritol kinase [Terriglobia bacterium]
MNPSIRLRAFAKINLGLKILGKRHDGYHEIRTVYQAITLHDRLGLTLTRRQGITIRCQEPAIPTGPGNLVYRACEGWMRARRWRGGIRADLEKRIPVGAGLGGGSSDAAAALAGLERLTGEKLSATERFRLLSDLGSDVPFFLVGGRALGCGRGEEIYPLADLPRRHCLVVYPRFQIRTPEAYQQAGLKLTSSGKDPKVNTFGVWSQFPLEGWGPAENDFEAFVFAKWPELERIKSQFIRAGAEIASLTGSGSAIYAIFDSIRQLIQASKLVPEGWSVFRAQSLSRQRYYRMMFDSWEVVQR